MSIRTARGWVLLSTVMAAGCSGPKAPARDAVEEAFRRDGLSAHQARGRRLFAQRCATCHGPWGRGDGQNAFNLEPAPPDFGESLGSLSTAERREVIVGGTAHLGRSPLCPPRGGALRPEDVEALLAYLAVMEHLEPLDDNPFAGRRVRRPR